MPPLQHFIYHEARARIDRGQRGDYYSSPAGQAVDIMTAESPVCEVMYDFLTEYADTVERMSGLHELGQ